MADQKDFIMVEGERRPAYKPNDAYLMAKVWFGGPGQPGGSVDFFCDSHFGAGRMCDALKKAANGKRKTPFTVELLATPDLVAFVESGPKGEGCIPTLAKKLVIIPSVEPDLFSFEYDGNQTLELHAGVEAAGRYCDGFWGLQDVWDGAREMWFIPEHMRTREPVKNSGPAVLFEAWAAWPGVHKNPKAALSWVQNGLYLKHPPGENDWGDEVPSAK